MDKKKTSSISRIRTDSERFSLSDIALNTFVSLGKQHKDPSIIHSVYIRRHTIGQTCYVQPRTKVSGYCSYSLVSCSNVGLLGVVFYTYKDKTSLTPQSLVMSRHVENDDVTDEIFTPLFTLERLDLLLYTSNYGSVVVIPTIVLDTSFLVLAG